VADQLGEEHGRGQFDKLVLVAPPRALTELKQSPLERDGETGGQRSTEGSDQSP
jgi:protein required for attachment to host cells